MTVAREYSRSLAWLLAAAVFFVGGGCMFLVCPAVAAAPVPPACHHDGANPPALPDCPYSDSTFDCPVVLAAAESQPLARLASGASPEQVPAIAPSGRWAAAVRATVLSTSPPGDRQAFLQVFRI